MLYASLRHILSVCLPPKNQMFLHPRIGNRYTEIRPVSHRTLHKAIPLLGEKKNNLHGHLRSSPPTMVSPAPHHWTRISIRRGRPSTIFHPLFVLESFRWPPVFCRLANLRTGFCH